MLICPQTNKRKFKWIMLLFQEQIGFLLLNVNLNVNNIKT